LQFFAKFRAQALTIAMKTPALDKAAPGGSGGKRRKLVFALGASLLAALAVSCVTTLNRVLVAPPHIPGATFVGTESCATCHEEVVRDFRTATHARLVARGENAAHMGCESCHGAGSLHVESGGAHHTIINPGRSPEVCFDCHLDKRGEFHLPHRHPVVEGKMTCSDCHEPHKGDAVLGRGTMLASQNDVCIECHTAQRGPHIFEHEATREGCTTCHAPHGSVNAKMLTARNSNLCLQCHFQQQTTAGRILIGGRDHTSFMARGSCWSAGCHEAVHGSQVNSSLRF
jgi:predicted CXXCH cytochrome family protein